MSGPGTELQKIFEWFAKRDQCENCAQKARVMDERGPEWVKENIDTVIRWVVANSRRMFVSRLIPEAIEIELAKQAIILACERSKKKKFETENTTGEYNAPIQKTDTTDTPDIDDGLRSAAQRLGKEQATDSREASSQSAGVDANKELG